MLEQVLPTLRLTLTVLAIVAGCESAGLLTTSLALIAVAPLAAIGQVPPGTALACHPDSARAIVESSTDTLYAWIPGRSPHEREVQYQFRVAQVRAVLAVLGALPLLPQPQGTEIAYPLAPTGAPELRDARPLVWFQVRNDGRLAALALEHRSRWPALDIALQRAVLRADSARRLLPLPPALAGDAVDLYMAIGVDRLPGSESVPVATYRWKRSRGGGVEERPQLLRFGYRPRFPAAAIREHAGDSIVMAFVIDTAGRADPSTIELLQATYREFAQEAVRAIRSAQYRPGRLNGCPVRARVQQPIYFTYSGP